MKSKLFLIFGIIFLVFALSFAVAANSNNRIQIWRNATTGSNISWVDFNGNWFMNGNLNVSGTIYSNGQLIGSGTMNSTSWNSTGPYVFLANTSAFVGIGTTTPANTLDIRGTGDYVFAAQGASAKGFVIAENAAYVDIIGLGAAHGSYNDIDFRTSATAGQLYLKTGGNVGIGTTGPGSKLSVSGGALDTTTLVDLGMASALTTGRSGTFDSGTLASINTRGDASSVELMAGVSAGYFTGISATANNAALFTGSLRLLTAGSERVRITTAGNVGIGTTNPTSKLDINGSINYGALNVFNSAGSSSFFVNTSLGRVGIGTTAPVAKLHLEDTTVGATIYQHFTNDGTGSTVSDGLRIGLNSIEEPMFWNFENTNMKFATNNALAMVIDNSGLVGIGTATPQNKLNVVGDLNVTGTIYGGVSGGTVSGSGTVGYIPMWNSTTSLNNSMLSQTGTGISSSGNITSAQFIVAPSGLVPSATGAPDSKIFSPSAQYGGDTWGIKYNEGSPDYIEFWGSSTVTSKIALDDGAADFGIGGGNFSVGTSDLFVDNSAGRVGIGTMAPSGKLSVHTGTDQNLHIIAGTNYGADGTAISSTNDAASGFRSLFFGASQFGFITGNVGIGTTGPSAKLHVSGGSAIIENAGAVSLTINDTSSSQIPTINFAQGGATRASIEGGVSLSPRLDFSLVGYSRMMTLLEGNVGIGTTSPQNKLNVIGDANITGTLYAGSMSVTNDAVTNLIVSNNATIGKNLSVSGNALFVNNNTGYVGVGTMAPTEKLDVNGVLRVGPTDSQGILALGNRGQGSGYYDTGVYRGGIGVTTEGNYLNFGGYSGIAFNSQNAALGSQSTRMFINGTSGNVGIGTTTPGRLLDVNGNANFEGVVYMKDGGYLYEDAGSLQLRPVSGNKLVVNTGDGSTKFIISNAGGVSIGNAYAATDAGAGNMIITGNVGIGTTSPDYKLDVEGATDTFHVQWGTPAGTYGAMFAADSRNFVSMGSRSNDDFRLFTNGVDVMSLTTTGNVGIGTTNPNDILHLFRTTSSGLTVQTSGADTNALISTQNDAKTWSFGIRGDVTDSFIIREAGVADRFVINNGGNVGIGTTAPTARFEVKSPGSSTTFANFTASTGLGNIQFYQSNNNHMQFSMAPSDGTATVVLNTAGISYLKGGNVIVGGSADNGKTFQVAGTASVASNFSVDTSDLFVNADTGNVGIGTTAPGAFKLTVNGRMNVVGDVYSNPTASDTPGLGANFISDYWSIKTGANGRLGIDTYNLGGAYQESVSILRNGNVGIGTTSPSTKFDVAITGLDDGLTFHKGSAKIAELIQNGGTGNGIFNLYDSSGNLDVALRANEVSFLNGGNVGIGTTTPQNKLNVIGDGNFTGNLYSNGALVGTGSVTGSGTLQYIPMWNGTTSLNNSNIYQLGGNIGIGLATPGAPLTIAHEASYSFPTPGESAKGAINIKMTTSSKETGITFSEANHDNAQAGLYVHQDNGAGTHMYFATTDSYATGPQARMTILANGNVGIGTTNPVSKLDVAGDIGLTSANSVIFGSSGTAQITGSDYSGIGGSSLVFKTYGTEKMRIIENGNVGIGTTTPQNKLNVIGDINATTNIYGNTIYEAGTSLANKYYGINNPFSFYNSTNPPIGYVTGTQLAGNITNFYMNTTNQFSYVNTTNFGNLNNIYLNTTNQFSYLNSTTLSATETDPKWSGNLTNFSNVYNYATNNTFYKRITNEFSYWNSTFATFNKTYADTLYYGINNPYSFYNVTTLNSLTNLNISNNLTVGRNLSVSGNALFVNNNTGYVGIGITSPGAKLDVAGDTYISNNGILFTDTIRPYTGDAISVLNGDNDILTINGTTTIWNNIISGISLLIPNGKVGIGTSTPNSTLEVNGSFAPNLKIINDDYTVADNDYTVLVNATAGGPAQITVTLPDALNVKGRIYNLKLIASIQLTLRPDSGDTIDNNSSNIVTSTRYTALTIQSDGGNNWNVLSRYIP